MAVSYAIQVKGLRKSFGAVPVLESVDLCVERGTMLALLGPNGAGKTTTVRILTTLLAPDGGTALVEGHDVAREPGAVRRMIGVTGQSAAVDELLTGEENLEMMGRLTGLRARPARRRAAELLAEFGLEGAARRPVRTYSGGMRRRLDLAAGLVARPSVLFLDEPTTGLDPTARAALWETIRGLLARGTTTLLTTQYLEEADRLAHRIAVIDGGRVVAEGTADGLKGRIGAERLELSFAPADLPLAHGLFTGGVRWTGGTVSVPVDGAADVLRLLNRAAAHGAEVVSMALLRPSLDDVFAELTGAGRPGGRS
ncbi:ATP-binding cassette domain-containing protein [Streptomyces sp. NPDC003691]